MKIAPKIIAISLNTAIDSIIRINEFELGAVQRAVSKNDFASGKAVNTIKSISSFPVKKKLIGFCGSDYLDGLIKEKSIDNDSIELITVNGKTRQNITLIEHSSDALLSHIQTEGYDVTEDEIQQLFDVIKKIIKPNDIVILSGSLPPGFDLETYEELISLIKVRKAKLILDTSGDALKSGLRYSPSVIKPNLEELADLMDYKKSDFNLSEVKNIVKQLKKNYSISHIFISLGEEGAIYSSENNLSIIHGSIDQIHQNTNGDEVGCGDSFIGGVALAIAYNLTDKQTLIQGIALATSNLYALGAGNVDINKYKEFEKKVRITEI